MIDIRGGLRRLFGRTRAPAAVTDQVEFALRPATSPTVNAPLLRQAMRHIRDNPHLWDQTRWAKDTPVGTAHCLGGWAVVLDTGVDFAESDHETVWNGSSVFYGARAALGLSCYQADKLFHFVTVETRGVRTGHVSQRHPTFEEFAEVVTRVTRVDLELPESASPGRAEDYALVR